MNPTNLDPVFFLPFSVYPFFHTGRQNIKKLPTVFRKSKTFRFNGFEMFTETWKGRMKGRPQPTFCGNKRQCRSWSCNRKDVCHVISLRNEMLTNQTMGKRFPNLTFWLTPKKHVENLTIKFDSIIKTYSNWFQIKSFPLKFMKSFHSWDIVLAFVQIPMTVYWFQYVKSIGNWTKIML